MRNRWAVLSMLMGSACPPALPCLPACLRACLPVTACLPFTALPACLPAVHCLPACTACTARTVGLHAQHVLPARRPACVCCLCRMFALLPACGLMMGGWRVHARIHATSVTGGHSYAAHTCHAPSQHPCAHGCVACMHLDEVDLPHGSSTCALACTPHPHQHALGCWTNRRYLGQWTETLSQRKTQQQPTRAPACTQHTTHLHMHMASCPNDAPQWTEKTQPSQHRTF